VLHFYGDSSAGAGQFTVNGGQVSGGGFAIIDFYDTSRAGSASFTINGGANGGTSGLLFFYGDSLGESAAVKLVDGGNLNISGHSSPGLIIGSLEGDGVVFLGKNDLSVGTNDLSTIFSGIVQDGGSLTKLGTGTLKLTGANTYTGGTTANAGQLVVNNTDGSGTGSGAVRVNAGILGGRGTITGAVTIGTGSGTGAFLAPSGESHRPTTLTIQNALSFKADATYIYNVNTKKTKADKVIANGVTIESGAQFSFGTVGNRNKKLPKGQVFVAISNSAATPIAGTFANLADGSTATVGSNTFQANYEGGDGNDLTLTVVP
jgi:autotransporter-associated beta strand protein